MDAATADAQPIRRSHIIPIIGIHSRPHAISCFVFRNLNVSAEWYMVLRLSGFPTSERKDSAHAAPTFVPPEKKTTSFIEGSSQAWLHSLADMR